MRLPGSLARHTEFIRHVATMASGKSVAAAIALFTTPIVARYFEPGDFGVAAAFMSIVSISVKVASLRYNAALVLPKEDQEAIMLMALSYRILFVFCLAMLSFIAIADLTGMSLSVLELLGIWAWLLPLAVLLTTSVHIQESWLTRKKSFKIVSGSMVLGSTVTSGSRIGFGVFSGTSVFGLILGHLLGTTARLLVQKSLKVDGFRAVSWRVGWQSMRQVARAYSDFPKFNAPAGFVSSLGGSLPVLLFGIMFSPAAAGFYAMANRLAKVPTTIISTSMRRVFLQKVAAMHSRGDSLRRAFLITTGGLALLGIVPLICLTMFGEPLLGWLLGERWLEAGRYLEIMAPWMFMIWVTVPANPVFVVTRKQKFWLALQTSLTVFRLSAFGLAFFLLAGPEWALHAFVLATIAGNVLTISIALMLISKQSAIQPDTAQAVGRRDSPRNDPSSK